MRKLWIAVLLAAALFATNSAMASVTITVHGTITSGTDTTGVFGALGANLAGDSVTIVYTINDATGTLTTTCASITCASSVTGVTSSAAISVGSSTPYVDSSTASLSRELYSIRDYFEVITSTDTYVQVDGYTATTVSSLTPDWDWRSSFSDSSSTDSGWSTLADFSINDGTNEAGAAFTVSSITQSGGDCSGVSSAVLAIDTSSTGQHPNILGGAVSANQSTVIGLTLSPVSSSDWYPVSFIDNDIAAHPTSSHETFDPPGAIANSTTGLGTVGYDTLLTSGVINDAVTAQVCASTPSPALSVYENYDYLNAGHTKQFDIGESQVSDTTFQNSSALSQSTIQSFLTGESAWIAHFYLDTTNPSNGGWYNSSTSATTSTFASGYTTYCPYVDGSDNPICPVSGDTGISASELIATAATTNSVNPAVLLATLQKEYGVLLATSQPSNDALDQAMGVGNYDFQTEINTSAATFNARFNDFDAGDFPYFFATNATEIANYNNAPPNDSVTQSIQYSWNTNAGDACERYNHDDCAIVGLWVENRATYAQYKYTPFVQTTLEGGGYYGFEYWWYKGSLVW